MSVDYINGKVSGYSFDDETPYEAEAVYYLNFQITSALSSLDHLSTLCNDGFVWENKYEYYHYYSDHLMFSIGQIANRFVPSGKDNQEKKERKKRNRNSFQFTQEQFPILSDKRARNVIEHIDERDTLVIQKHNGVGGFNVIDDDVEDELATFLLNNKETHIYTLDLESEELLIRDKDEDLVVNFEKLRAELLSLQENVNWLRDMIRKANVFLDTSSLPEGVTIR